MKLDEATIDALVREATSNRVRARREFLKTDCSDAMHWMETWERVVEWLEEKRTKRRSVRA